MSLHAIFCFIHNSFKQNLFETLSSNRAKHNDQCQTVRLIKWSTSESSFATDASFVNLPVGVYLFKTTINNPTGHVGRNKWSVLSYKPHGSLSLDLAILPWASASENLQFWMWKMKQVTRYLKKSAKYSVLSNMQIQGMHTECSLHGSDGCHYFILNHFAWIAYYEDPHIHVVDIQWKQ